MFCLFPSFSLVLLRGVGFKAVRGWAVGCFSSYREHFSYFCFKSLLNYFYWYENNFGRVSDIIFIAPLSNCRLQTMLHLDL